MKRSLPEPQPAAAAEALPHLPDDDTTAAVRQAVAAVLDKKGEELKVLQVGEVTHFTDYFLLCSGQSGRQVQAIADGVEEQLRAHGRRPRHVEGYPSGQWVLMDFGDLVLHVFLHERRRFYGLERLWGDAPDVTAELVAAAALATGAGPQRV